MGDKSAPSSPALVDDDATMLELVTGELARTAVSCVHRAPSTWWRATSTATQRTTSWSTWFMLRPFTLTDRLPAPPRHAVDRYLDGSILSSLTTKSRSNRAFSCFAIAWSERGWSDVRRKAFGSALLCWGIPAGSSLLLLSG